MAGTPAVATAPPPATTSAGEVEAGFMFPPVVAGGPPSDLGYAQGYIDEKPTTIPYEGPVLEPLPPLRVIDAAVDLRPDPTGGWEPSSTSSPDVPMPEVPDMPEVPATPAPAPEEDEAPADPFADEPAPSASDVMFGTVGFVHEKVAELKEQAEHAMIEAQVPLVLALSEKAPAEGVDNRPSLQKLAEATMEAAGDAALPVEQMGQQVEGPVGDIKNAGDAYKGLKAGAEIANSDKLEEVPARTIGQAALSVIKTMLNVFSAAAPEREKPLAQVVGGALDLGTQVLKNVRPDAAEQVVGSALKKPAIAADTARRTVELLAGETIGTGVFQPPVAEPHATESVEVEPEEPEATSDASAEAPPGDVADVIVEEPGDVLGVSG